VAVLGLGVAMSVAPRTTGVVGSGAAHRTGVASGINNAVARVASLLAVAVLGIVFVWSHDAALSARLDALHVPHDARQSAQLSGLNAAAGAQAGGAHTPPQTPQTPTAQAEADAIVAALRAVALVSAACAFAGAGLALATIQRRR